MSTTKPESNYDIKLYKQPFSIPELIMALLFSTYFLTIQTIELSLSTYVLQENKTEMYREYLIFKGQAPIWKWWQLFTVIIIPLSVIIAIRDLFQTFTKKATIKRNLLDIVTALQLSGMLYTMLIHVSPLENKLIQATSKDNAHELNFFQWIVFLLNIVGWIIPLFRYQDWKNDRHINSKKKTQ